MKNNAMKMAAVTVAMLLLAAAWGALFCKFRATEYVMFPSGTFEVYALTDRDMGGFSTSELSQGDSGITAKVNIRSGMAYPYAGIGFNLMSVNKRPATGFFDFSQYDSVEVNVETGRMRNVTLRILDNDPMYSKENVYATYRPLQKSMPVGEGGFKMALFDLKVPDRWLAAQGLEKDDGLKYFQRGVLVEIANGEGTMLGIPDEILLKGVRLWGVNRGFVSAMYAVAIVLALLWIGLLIYLYRNSVRLKTLGCGSRK